ncbi:MAG: helix-turn-helix domain-containing protein [Nitrospirae bacterium]|nr:MAG: helix-turn-helix domain-containing protein [Nitrospirota bacterium]
MHLSVKDVAKMLNVSEKTVYRMVRNETIPFYRVGGQWRFDRRHIRSWLADAGQFTVRTVSAELTREDEETISITEFIRRGGIYRDIKGRTKEAAVRACLDIIGKAVPHLDARRLFDSIMERERLCPTAIGNELAMPHPRHFSRFTTLSYIALCFLEQPIPFESFDKEQMVDTLIFIFPRSELRFLRIQAKLLRLLKDEQVLSMIKGGSRGEIYDLLSSKEAEIFGKIHSPT